MLITAASLDALRTSFRLEYNTGFAGFPSQWKRVATPVPSSTKSNTYGWLRDFPRLREWIGDRHVKSIAEGSYAVENKKYEVTIGVKADDIRDDNLGIYGPLMRGMGESAAQFPDEQVFTLLVNGFQTECWDGQNFFDAEHPVMNDAGDTYSNMAAGDDPAWFLLDVSRALKPLIYQERQAPKFAAMTQPEDEQVFMKDEFRYGVDQRSNSGFGFPQMAYGLQVTLNAANYAAARQAMTSRVSETGHKLNIKPNLLVHGPSNRSAALATFEASLVPVGGAMGSNIYYHDIELFEVPWLN